jgi:hypothetical protein
MGDKKKMRINLQEVITEVVATRASVDLPASNACFEHNIRSRSRYAGYSVAYTADLLGPGGA